MRKPDFHICKNKDADQLRGNREADQRLCFRYTDSTITLLSKYELLSLLPSSVAVQSGLCLTWSETPKTGFQRSSSHFEPRQSLWQQNKSQKKQQQNLTCLTYDPSQAQSQRDPIIKRLRTLMYKMQRRIINIWEMFCLLEGIKY